MSKVQVDTIDTRSGTATMQIGSTNTSTINIGVSGDTVNIPAGVTIANAGTSTGFGGTNTPFVLVRNSAAQNCDTGTATKITFDTEIVDTDNEFSSNKWTCGTAGRYFFNCTMEMQSMNDAKENWMKIYKNGSAMVPTFTQFSGAGGYFNSLSITLDVAQNDYFEIYALQNNGNMRQINAETAVWSIVRIIES